MEQRARARTGNRLDDYLASPFSLASAWGAAHRGHLRTTPHELLLNQQLQTGLQLLLIKAADWSAAAVLTHGSSPCSWLAAVPRRRPHLRLSSANMAKR
eukprot:scaffold32247_cov60-Phaeocystis_antarctica.AAC.2